MSEAIAYSIRVTPPTNEFHEWRDILRRSMDRHGGSYFFVREVDANRPHLQGVYITTANIESFKRLLKRHGMVGNSCFSCKVTKDIDKYEVYLCKEDPVDVQLRYGIRYDDEWLVRTTERCRVQQEEFQQQTGWNVKLNAIENLEAICRAKDITDRYEICGEMVKQCCGRKKAYAKHMMATISRIVHCRINGEDAIRDLQDEIYNLS